MYEVNFLFEGQPINLLTAGPHDHIARIVSKEQRFYEMEMLQDMRRNIQPGAVIMDIGANIGNHTVFLGKCTPTERIVSIEPYPANIELLRENVLRNKLDGKVIIVNSAAGEKVGTSFITLDNEDNAGMARIAENGIRVSMKSIDNIVEEQSLSRCDILKIDVEGYELPVLKGARDTLKKFHPLIYVESRDTNDFSWIQSFLSEYGYRAEGLFNSTPTFCFRYDPCLDMTSISKEVMCGDRPSRPLRIAFFAGDGGNFHFVDPIIKHYRQKGHHIVKITDPTPSVEMLQKMMNWSDVSWFEWANGPIERVSHLQKPCRIVCRLHRYELYTNSPKVVNWKNIDGLIFVSPKMASLMEEMHHPDIRQQTNVHVVPNAIDLEDFPFASREKGYKIACVARMNPAKNIPLLLQVMACLTQKDKRYHCYVAGEIQDATVYQYFLKMRNELGLQKNITYEGPLDDIDSWLEDKHYILSTSMIESHGVSIMEGMAKGLKPVIHNWFGDPANFYEKEWIFNTIDEAVQMIISDKYEPLRYRKHIEKHFSRDVQIDKMDHILFENHPLPAIKNESPHISIVIPTYNRANFLGETIKSALNQTYPNMDIVIADDGSTDDTVTLIESIDDPRVRCFEKEHTNGPDTRNRVLDTIDSEFVLWLGSDDILLPNLLDYYMSVMRQWPDQDVYYGDIIIFDDERSAFSLLKYRDLYNDPNIIARLFRECMIPDGGSLIRRDLIRKAGGYDVSLKRAHDYEFWSRAAAFAKFKHSGITNYFWRQHSGNMSSPNKVLDYSYEARIAHLMLQRYPLQRLYPELSWNKRPQSDAVAWYWVARQFLQWNDISSAVQSIEKALQFFPKFKEAQELRNQLILKIRQMPVSSHPVADSSSHVIEESVKIHELIKQKHFQNADLVLAEVEKRFPNDPDLLECRADWYYAQQQGKMAAVSYKKSLSIDSLNIIRYERVIPKLIHIGDKVGALRLLTMLSNKYRGYPECKRVEQMVQSYSREVIPDSISTS